MAYPKGVPFSEEQRARVSKGVKNSKHAEVLRNSEALKRHTQRLAETNLGAVRSPETRAKMSASRHYDRTDPQWQEHYDKRLREILDAERVAA